MRQDQIFSVLHEVGTSGLEVVMVLRIVVDLRVSGVTMEACENWLSPYASTQSRDKAYGTAAVERSRLAA